MTCRELADWAEYLDIERRRVDKLDFYMAQMAAIVSGALGRKKVTLGEFLMSSRLKDTQVKLSISDLGKALDAMAKQGICAKKGQPNVSRSRHTQSVPKRGRNRLDKRAKPGA